MRLDCIRIELREERALLPSQFRWRPGRNYLRLRTQTSLMSVRAEITFTCVLAMVCVPAAVSCLSHRLPMSKAS